MLAKNPAQALLRLVIVGPFEFHFCDRSGRFVQLRPLSRHLASSEILAEIGSCNAERTSERQFCEIVAVQAGDVLVVCAGQGLFGLHYLDAISDACRKALLRTG